MHFDQPGLLVRGWLHAVFITQSEAAVQSNTTRRAVALFRRALFPDFLEPIECFQSIPVFRRAGIPRPEMNLRLSCEVRQARRAVRRRSPGYRMLPMAVALDGSGKYRTPRGIGGELVQQPALAPTANDMHLADRATGQFLNLRQRVAVEKGQALEDRAGEPPGLEGTEFGRSRAQRPRPWKSCRPA